MEYDFESVLAGHHTKRISTVFDGVMVQSERALVALDAAPDGKARLKLQNASRKRGGIAGHSMSGAVAS